MLRVLKLFVASAVFLVLMGSAFADDLSNERYLFKTILKNVAGDVSKNYYDAKLKGVDWKAATGEATQKIEAARSVNEMELAIYQLLEKLDDSHTVFIPPDSSVTAKYGFDAKAYGDQIYVYEVEPKSAAAVAGLKVGDRILQINGFEVERGNIERVLIYARKIYQVSPMTLLISRPDKTITTIEFAPKIITHAVVLNRESGFNALWALAMDDAEEYMKKYGTYRYGMQEGVGWFQVREFPDESEDFLKGLAEKTRDARAVIIDLRGNPGGYSKVLLSFAGLFQTAESDLATQVGRTKSEPLTVKPRRPYFGMPLFVLVDSDTASAAEMLARHLQKTRNATIIGDNTSGEVMVSKTFGGSVGGGMVTYYASNISIGRVVFPESEELEKKGVTPDVKCLPTQQDMRDGKDPCLAKAFSLAKEAGKTATAAKN